MIRDVYNEVYGVFPEDDDPADATDRMKEIATEAWAALNIKVMKPGSTELLREYATKGTPKFRRGAIMRQLPDKLKEDGYSPKEIEEMLDSISITKQEGGNVNAVTSELADTIAANALAMLAKNKEAADAESFSSSSTGYGGQERDVDNGSTGETTQLGKPEVDTQPQSGESVADAKPQASASTIDARVSEAADKAIITLPVKVLEGPPIVMPSREPGQGSAPGEIQTRPNDRTLNSASSNLNASRQMAYT
jgi:hypothetical protein